MLIRCTAKLLKEIGLTKDEASENESSESTLGDWYAHLFFIERKKCLIFTNARTFFTFMVFNINRAQIRSLGDIFRAELGKVLLEEDFDGALIQRLIDECRDIQFGRTNSKSVLGVMNDHVRNTKWLIWEDGGLGKFDIPRLIKHHNRTIFSPNKYAIPIVEFGKVLGVEIDQKKVFK